MASFSVTACLLVGSSSISLLRSSIACGYFLSDFLADALLKYALEYLGSSFMATVESSSASLNLIK